MAEKSLLNGSSLSNLTGAETRAKIHTEVRFPISSMQEVMETIRRMGSTGNLTLNFSHGKALDMKWASSRDTKPPET